MLLPVAALLTPAWRFPAVPRSPGLRAASPFMLDHEKVSASFSGDEAAISRDSDLVFAVLDRDGDGVISKAEMCDHLAAAGYEAAMIEKIFNRFESDQDGVISREELRTTGAKH